MEIVATTIDNIKTNGVCGYKNENRPGFKEKIK
jgi:hypothetical protein